MSSENTLTGRLGSVDVDTGGFGGLIAYITEWSVNPTMATSSEWGHSDPDPGGVAPHENGAGYTNRLAGRRDASAETEGKHAHDSNEWMLFQPGDIVGLTLWLTSVPDSALYWHFPRALCTDFSLTVDVDSEEVIGWEASWGADGEYFYPGQVGAPARQVSFLRDYFGDTREHGGAWESQPFV